MRKLILLSLLTFLLLAGCDLFDGDNNTPLEDPLTAAFRSLIDEPTCSVDFVSLAKGGAPPYQHDWLFEAGNPRTSPDREPRGVRFPGTGDYLIRYTVLDQRADSHDAENILSLACD